MIDIQVIANDGQLIAHASHETEAMLCVNRAYQPGDRINDLDRSRRGAQAGLRTRDV